MKKFIRAGKIIGKSLILFAFLLISSFCLAEDISDIQIKKIIIQGSINSYPGSCPCPYNTDRAGRRCGKRSAWSRAGGYAPLCYDSDVTDDMVLKYRKQHLQKKD